MKKQIINIKKEIKLAGITVITNNTLESNPKTSRIAKTINAYFDNNICKKIENRTDPNTRYCAYTKYESNENGNYTYFIGEEVSSFDNIDILMLDTLTIHPARYVKFECGPGEMPDICIDSWKEIWKMSNEDLSGEREYITDFEVYDKRASCHLNTVLDIYIGIKN